MTVEPCVAIGLAQLSMNFDRRYALCIQKIYHRPHFTVGGSWNKSLNLRPLQRCYCENSGSPASACVMRRHYSITYIQSVHAIIGLIAVGLVGNLFCGHPSYINSNKHGHECRNKTMGHEWVFLFYIICSYFNLKFFHTVKFIYRVFHSTLSPRLHVTCLWYKIYKATIRCLAK